MNPSIFALRPRSRVRRLWCAWFRCRWEERIGYDWCPRCHASRWHVARRLQQATGARPATTALADLVLEDMSATAR